MTKKLMRAIFCLTTAIIAVLGFAFVSVDDSKIGIVKADTTIGPVTVVSEYQYGADSYEDYAYHFTETWYTFNSIIDDDYDAAGGEITNVRLYEWDEGMDDWWEVYDANDTMSDTSDDYGTGVLVPGEYAVQYKWSTAGDFVAGESSIVPFTVVPYKFSNNFDAMQFTGVYDDEVNWYFAGNFYVFKQSDPYTHEEDDVNVVWVYDVNGEPVALDGTTDAGTYQIYPILTGAHKGRYELDLSYSDPYEGIYNQPITQANPVECTITKKDIQVVVSYLGNDLNMYDDGASEVINTIHYNGVLPLQAYCPSYNVLVNIDWFRNANTYEQYTDGIEALGTYFATSASFSLVDEETYLNPNNFNIVNSNCKITIAQRIVQVYGYMSSKYVNGPSYPEYDVSVYYDAGENEYNVLTPEFDFDGASTIASDYMGNGHAILVLRDSTSYAIQLAMEYSDRTEWDYTVGTGDADIKATQINPWYYRQEIDDIYDIFEFNVSTVDPEEEVEIYSIEWTLEAYPNVYTTWYDFASVYPTVAELDSPSLVTYGMNIRVTTNYSTNHKFDMTSEIFHVEISKAPVYVRVVNTDLTYNGEEQAPEYANYRYYIYSADDEDNIWSLKSGFADLSDFIDFVDDGSGGSVPHIWTESGVYAGTYNLHVVLNPAVEDRFELIENDKDFNGITVDEDAVYVIKKAMLQVDDYVVDEFEYGTYIDLQDPTFSGFIGDENFYSAGLQVKWYYNTVARYAEEEAWLDADELFYSEYPNARCDVPAGTYYIKCVVTSTNYATITLTGEDLVVNPKELSFSWYENEEAYNFEPSAGIETDNDMSIVVASLTYNGQAQSLFYKIWNTTNNDVVTVTTINFYEKDWTPVDAAVNVGDYIVVISAINNANYKFPHGYSNVVARFEITPATLTITPDSGASKVYGGADPEFTYIVTGALGTDSPVVTGALSRVAGSTVGNYNITLGTVALTDAEVNDNYVIELNATPVTFAITPKTITANFINKSKYYTSAALTPDFNGFTGLEAGDTVNINYVGGNTIGAGEYDKEFELIGADAGNYVLSTNVVPFTILQALVRYTAKLDGNANLSVEYDGNEHTLTVSMTNIQGTDDVDIVINSNATGTSSGMYAAALALTGTKAPNYRFEFGGDYTNQVTWYITKAGVDYAQFNAAFLSDTSEYDSGVHTVPKIGSIPSGYTYKYYVATKENGVYAGTSTEFTGETEVGVYYVEVRFTPDSDHDPVDSLYRDIIITKKAITIDWNNYIFTYDGTAHLPEIALKGLVIFEKDGVEPVWNIVGQVNATNGVVAKVTGLTGTYAEHYELSGQTQVSMVINKREIKVTAVAKSSYYGDEIVELTATISNSTIVEGDVDVYELSTTATSASSVGSYAIVGEQGDNNNYIVTFKNAIYSITPRPVTVTIDDKSSIYGDSPVGLTAVVTGGVVNGDTNIYSLSCVVSKTSDVGLYDIVGSAQNANYDITFVNEDDAYEVVARKITIIYTGVHKVVTYGDNDAWDALGEEMYMNDYYLAGNNFANNDDILDAVVIGFNTQADGNGMDMIPDVTTPIVNTYYMIVEGDDANYDFTIELGDEAYLQIVKRELTITADDKDIIFGDVAPEFTVSYEGFADNEDESVLGGELVLVCEYAQFDDVGEYDIIASGLSNNNYDITFVEGTLTVAPRAITITYTGEKKSVVYGDDIVWEELGDDMYDNVYYLVGNNFVNNDNIFNSVTIGFNTKADGSGNVMIPGQHTPNAGVYYMIVEGDNDNYDFTINLGENAVLLVQKAQLTITADDKDIIYGDEEPAFTVVYDGFVLDEDEDDLGGELVLVCDYEQFDDVGEYDIIASGLTSNNYVITFVDGTLTVAPRAITITIDDKTSVYGNATLGLTCEVTDGELAVVDEIADVYVLSCDASNLQPVGNYAITGEAISDNYDITFVDGEYVITARPITITIANKTSVYGNAVVALTSTVTAGSIANDDANVYTLTCQASNVKPVDNYPITGVLGVDATNYSVTFVDGTYAITIRPITVTIYNKTSVFGDDIVPLTSAVTTGSIVNNDTNVYALLCDIDSATPAGNYPITGVKGSNNNYNVTFVNGNYEITKRASYEIEAIDEKEAATNGIDLTNVFNSIDTSDKEVEEGQEEEEVKVTIPVGGGATIEFNKEAIKAINEAVANSAEPIAPVFKFKALSEEEVKEAEVKGAEAIFEISLEGIPFEEGKVTVSLDFENKAPNGKVAKLYYITPEGKKVDMKATFADNKVVFTTNHFSTFAIVYESTTNVLLIVIIIVLVVAAIAACVFFILKKKGAKNGKQPVKENKVEEKAEEASEEQAEEKAEDKKEDAKDENPEEQA